jgi:hypothetical protein
MGKGLEDAKVIFRLNLCVLKSGALFVKGLLIE